MSRRKQIDLELETLLKQQKELQEKLDQLTKEKERTESSDSESEKSSQTSRCSESSVSSGSSNNSEEKRQKQGEKKRRIDDRYDTMEECNNITEHNTETPELPLSEALQLVLGDEPNKDKAMQVKIHSGLISRWQYYATNGMKKEEREEALKKYHVPEALAAPALNEQIEAKLSDKMVRRDNYRFQAQKLASAALTSLGAAITMANEEGDDGLDQEEFLTRLTDAAKLLAEVQFQQSETRKAFIVPRFSKSFQEILKKSKPDKFLFGKELPAKIKELKDSERLFKEVTGNQQNRYANQPSTRASGNASRPLEQRPLSNRQGTTSFRGQGKRRLYFRRSAQQRDPRRYQNQNQKQRTGPKQHY